MVPRVLSIAGSDSGGGAGIQADIKAMTAFGVYSMTAVTAVTVQNTVGVQDVHTIPSSQVRAQIDAVIQDIGCDVIKIGMLGPDDTIRTVHEAIKEHCVPNVILDPVMVSTSGSVLLSDDSVAHLVELLLPNCLVLTPNYPEARALVQKATGSEFKDAQTVDDCIDLAKAIQRLGPKWVLLKGGHTPADKDGTIVKEGSQDSLVNDILTDGTRVTVFSKPFSDSRNTHGTGCSLASAIAANVAKGMQVPEAVRISVDYIEAAIASSFSLGQGHGPLNHMANNYTLPFSRYGHTMALADFSGHFLDYLLAHPKIKPLWDIYTQHPFVNALGSGSLEVNKFRDYLVQDYLYLTHFARATSLAGYKSGQMQNVVNAANIVLHINHEMQLHAQYCSDLGISQTDLENASESPANTAYNRFVLDIGNQQDWYALQIAMAPCLFGYGMIADRLYNAPTTKRSNNVFFRWIANYVADDYKMAVAKGRAQLEENAVLQSSHRIEQLVDIFAAATRFEAGFWAMGFEGSAS